MDENKYMIIQLGILNESLHPFLTKRIF